MIPWRDVSVSQSVTRLCSAWIEVLFGVQGTSYQMGGSDSPRRWGGYSIRSSPSYFDHLYLCMYILTFFTSNYSVVLWSKESFTSMRVSVTSPENALGDVSRIVWIFSALVLHRLNVLAGVILRYHLMDTLCSSSPCMCVCRVAAGGSKRFICLFIAPLSIATPSSAAPYT